MFSRRFPESPVTIRPCVFELWLIIIISFQAEIGALHFTERSNFNKVSSEPKKNAQLIRVRGMAAPRVF